MRRPLALVCLSRCLAIVAVALALASCGGDNGLQDTPLDQPIASERAGFTVDLAVPHDALQRGTNAFTVTVHNADGTPGSLSRIAATMPAHGHSTDPPVIDLVAPGQYTVRDLVLTMPGVWELDLTLSRTGATDDDAAIVITEVQ